LALCLWLLIMGIDSSKIENNRWKKVQIIMPELLVEYTALPETSRQTFHTIELWK
jgi:hypothetical protein